MSSRVDPRSPAARSRPGIPVLPTTGGGRWAVGLAALFFAFVSVSTVVPRGAVFAFVCALAGGAAALTSIVRDHERAVTVFLALVPPVIGVAFALAQLVSGAG